MSATGRGTTRIDSDLYSTPLYAVRLIFDKINKDTIQSSLEPCRADGRIYDLLPGRRHWCEIREGIDYLNPANTFDVDLIITNPPFSLALQFLKKSLSEATTVCYLLRLNFLGSQSRRSFWVKNPPTHLYVLSKRPSFVYGRTDATEYAWFCWDKSGKMIIDSPGIYVL